MKKLILLLLISVFFFQGCREKQEEFSKILNKTEVNTVKYGNLEIVFPLGSLKDDGKIRIIKAPPKDNPDQGLNIIPVYAMSIDTKPVKALEITINFNPQVVEGKYENLIILMKDEGVWTPLKNQLVNIESNTVAAQITTISDISCVISTVKNNTINRATQSYINADPKVQRLLKQKGIIEESIKNIVEVTPVLYRTFDVQSPVFSSYLKGILKDFVLSVENKENLREIINERASAITAREEHFVPELSIFTKAKGEKKWNKVKSNIFKANNNPGQLFAEMSTLALNLEKEIRDNNVPDFLIQRYLNPKDSSIGNYYLIYTLEKGVGDVLYNSSFYFFFHEKKINNYVEYYSFDLSARLSVHNEAQENGAGEVSKSL